MACILCYSQTSIVQALRHFPTNSSPRHIINTYTTHKNFNEDATKHKATTWHKHSLQVATHFLAISRKPVKLTTCLFDVAVNRKIKKNRSKLAPILSPILLCATHDIAPRGKESDTGNIQGLFQFRIEAETKHYLTIWRMQQAMQSTHRSGHRMS